MDGRQGCALIRLINPKRKIMQELIDMFRNEEEYEVKNLIEIIRFCEKKDLILDF